VSSTFEDYPNLPAMIQISSGEPNGSKIQIPCAFSAMDGKRLILEAPERISMSTPVSVEYNDAMFLGEVILCKSDLPGSYRVEIYVEQILTGLQSLMALRVGLLGASQTPDPTAARPHAFVPANNQTRNLRN
jgi:hypothetical protein